MYDNPPFWEHGVFLQPQHFQLERLQSRRILAATLPLLNPWLWGVRRLTLNEDALSGGEDANEGQIRVYHRCGGCGNEP